MTDTDPALQPEDPARRQLLGASVMMGTAFAFGIGPVAAADTKTGRDNNSMRTHTVERIQFSSGGETLVGLLCAPTGAPAARAAVVLLGPFGFVKEQSPVQYATRLADAGFVALIFDPRCSGESGGSPRRHEDPLDKIDDAKAAIAWLARRPEVDPARIGALGVCQGCSEMIAVAADEARVKALVLVSGQYLYAENLRKFFAGGGPTLEERIARGRAAKARYEAAGLVDYTDVVSATDPAAGLRFGFVGTVTDHHPHEAMWGGWRRAIADPALSGASAHVYGHLGFFANHRERIGALLPLREGIGVSYDGPVAKADIGATYAGLDVILLMAADSRFVTSGKVFECMATGKPIVGVYSPRTAIAEPLEDYPLSFPAAELTPAGVADALVAAAHGARAARPADHEAALAHARPFRRDTLLAPFAEDLAVIAGA